MAGRNQERVRRVRAVRRYLARKLIIYVITFFVAATIDWLLPRLVPGNPIQLLLSKMNLQPQTYNATYNLYMKAFGFNRPWWKQYLSFWQALLHGNLGVSIYEFPKPVTHVIADYVLFTLALAHPCHLAGAYFAGNRVGAMAARRKPLDNSVLPVGYILTATAYPWLALLLAFLLAAGGIGHFFPISGGFSYGLIPTWSWTFIWSLITHWVLPFLTLFLVAFGGWAIGMRNLIIYELESDYSHYLEALGAPSRLVRKYAYRNAGLPQLTGTRPAARRPRGRGGGHRGDLCLPWTRLAHPPGCRQRRLLLAARHLLVHNRRCSRRQLRHRHRLRARRPPHPRRDQR